MSSESQERVANKAKDPMQPPKGPQPTAYGNVTQFPRAQMDHGGYGQVTPGFPPAPYGPPRVSQPSYYDQRDMRGLDDIARQHQSGWSQSQQDYWQQQQHADWQQRSAPYSNGHQSDPYDARYQGYQGAYADPHAPPVHYPPHDAHVTQWMGGPDGYNYPPRDHQRAHDGDPSPVSVRHRNRFEADLVEGSGYKNDNVFFVVKHQEPKNKGDGKLAAPGCLMAIGEKIKKEFDYTINSEDNRGQIVVKYLQGPHGFLMTGPKYFCDAFIEKHEVWTLIAAGTDDTLYHVVPEPFVKKENKGADTGVNWGQVYPSPGECARLEEVRQVFQDEMVKCGYTVTKFEHAKDKKAGTGLDTDWYNMNFEPDQEVVDFFRNPISVLKKITMPNSGLRLNVSFSRDFCDYHGIARCCNLRKAGVEPSPKHPKLQCSCGKKSGPDRRGNDADKERSMMQARKRIMQRQQQAAIKF